MLSSLLSVHDYAEFQVFRFQLRSMSDIDWADVKAVRGWLEARYSIANRQRGSPFFQYLKDELAKGNKIRGRERHFCGDELLRWIGDTQGDRAFHYAAGSMRTEYYPEYDGRAISKSSLDSHPNQQVSSKLPHGSTTTQPPSQQSERPAVSKHRNRKPVRKRNGAKVDFSNIKSGTKSPQRKPTTSANKSKAASKPKGLKNFGSGGSRAPDLWTSRLRSSGSHKRSKTGKNSTL